MVTSNSKNHKSSVILTVIDSTNCHWWLLSEKHFLQHTWIIHYTNLDLGSHILSSSRSTACWICADMMPVLLHQLMGSERSKPQQLPVSGEACLCVCPQATIKPCWASRLNHITLAQQQSTVPHHRSKRY